MDPIESTNKINNIYINFDDGGGVLLPIGELKGFNEKGRKVVSIEGVCDVSIQLVKSAEASAGFSAPELNDIIIVHQVGSVAKGIYKFINGGGALSTGTGRVLSSAGLLGVVRFPVAAYEIKKNIAAAIATDSHIEKTEASFYVIGNVGDIVETAATVVVGLGAAMEGTQVGLAIAESAAIWAAPVAVVGGSVLLVFAGTAKGIGMYRTYRTVQRLDGILDGSNKEAIDNAKKSRIASGDKKAFTQLDDHSKRVVATLDSLANEKDSYLGNHFFTRHPVKVRASIQQTASRILATAGSENNDEKAQSISRGEKLIAELKGRASRKMKTDVLSIALMIVSLVAVTIMAFTALTPIGWALYTIVAVVGIGIFVVNWRYRRSELKTIAPAEG